MDINVQGMSKDKPISRCHSPVVYAWNVWMTELFIVIIYETWVEWESINNLSLHILIKAQSNYCHHYYHSCIHTLPLISFLHSQHRNRQYCLVLILSPRSSPLLRTLFSLFSAWNAAVIYEAILAIFPLVWNLAMFCNKIPLIAAPAFFLQRSI